MNENNKITNDNQYSEEDDTMNANVAIKIDNNTFNAFLKANKDKINAMIPKNPSISKDDEWRNEDFWDDLSKETKK